MTASGTSPSTGRPSARRSRTSVLETSTGATGTAGRRALREARRQRRRLMAVCAAIVAACLVMTVLIVGMARDRPAQDGPTGVVVRPAADALSTPYPTPYPAVPPGAPAPEGGHR